MIGANKIRLSLEIGGIKRKLISLTISSSDGSLFIALRGLPAPVYFLNLIMGNIIKDYRNFGFGHNSKNIKVSFHTRNNEICLPVHRAPNKRVNSKSTKLPWWKFYAPKILSQIIIPASILSEFPVETKSKSSQCYNLKQVDFDGVNPLVIYFCLVDDVKKLKNGIIIGGNRWESDSMIYGLHNTNSFFTVRIGQRINNSVNTIYGNCTKSIFWVFDPNLVEFDNQEKSFN